MEMAAMFPCINFLTLMKGYVGDGCGGREGVLCTFSV